MKNLNRRDFLGTSMAMGAAAALAPWANAADDGAELKLGAQTYTYRQFGLERMLKELQGLGLRYGEFYGGHIPADSSDDQIAAALNLCKEYQVQPIGFGVVRFTADADANRKQFEFAKKLSVKYLSADPTPDAFDSLDKLVEEYGVAIAIHPHGPVGGKLHHWYSAEIILEAVKDHHPLIGACLDTGHLIRSAQQPFGKKLDPAQQIRVMGARNFGIHLKDHDNENRRDVIFGQGSLDVPAVLQALRDVKFTGGLNIEYEANPDNPTPDMKACVKIVRDAMKV